MQNYITNSRPPKPLKSSFLKSKSKYMEIQEIDCNRYSKHMLRNLENISLLKLFFFTPLS